MNPPLARKRAKAAAQPGRRLLMVRVVVGLLLMIAAVRALIEALAEGPTADLQAVGSRRAVARLVGGSEELLEAGPLGSQVEP